MATVVDGAGNGKNNNNTQGNNSTQGKGKGTGKGKSKGKGKGKGGKPKPRPSFFMFPDLHQKITDRLIEDGVSAQYGFNMTGGDDNVTVLKETNVMGKFRCTTGGCGGYWGSKKVAITIRQFHVGNPGSQNKAYNASVFNQRCKKCDKLGILELDEESYLDRVVYRIKVWERVPVETPPHDNKKGPEHERALCEGCRLGKCLAGQEIRGIEHYHFGF